MKAASRHIALCLFVAATVLFNQVGLKFLHDEHDAHVVVDQQTSGQTQLYSHGEHCDTCSIDWCTPLFTQTQTPLCLDGSVDTEPRSEHPSEPGRDESCSQGRAPPIRVA